MSAFPLTAEQRSMLFLDGVFGPGIFHNVSFGAAVPAGTSEEAVRTAIAALTSRHDGLLSRSVGSSPFLQAVSRETVEPVSRGLSGNSLEAEFDRLRSDLHNIPLAPSRARFDIIKNDAGDPLQVLGTVDHLVADGYSGGLLGNDLSALLAGRPTESTGSFPEIALARAVGDREAAAEIAHWRRAAAGTRPLAGIVRRAGPRAAWVRAQVDREVPGGEAHRRLRELVQACRATPFAVLAAVTAVAVWRRSGRSAFLLHTPVSTRRDAVERATAGNFVMDRPIPCRIDPGEPLSALVGRVQAAVWRAARYARLSVPELLCAVPEYGAALLEDGADYLQLHVDVQSADATGVLSSPGGSTGVRTLGPFAPAHDLTVTTLRFRFSESRLFTRVFSGGSPDGIRDAEELCADALAVFDAIAQPGDTARELADRLDRAEVPNPV
ncbi:MULTISPECIES: condensation domain-containing protein [Kitasatospora]|uniref:condensation domain-containing protein n=1 Tax=Kitasatospora TaxID=2063 RepID=UPI000526F8F2|nr:condensation domain-containing protein [Kitasatospora setae]